MYDDDTFRQSQDVLATLTHQQNEFIGNREPWRREFNCTTVPFETVRESSVQNSGSSTGSHGLPSLREEYADFAQLGSTSFPIALVDTSRGIEFLFGRIFKVLRRLSNSPNIINMKEFMQVLGLIEFIGSEIYLNETTAVRYLEMYSYFLLKIGVLSKTAAMPAYTCSLNFPFHASLFAWSFACRLFETRSSLPIDNKSRLTPEDAFIVLLDGLAVFKQNIGSAIPCSCVHSVLLELYNTVSGKLLKCFFRMVECLANSECPYSSSEFGALTTKPANFLAFFADVISHFIDIRVITSNDIMTRFVLMVGMGDLLCDTELLSTCKVLLLFMKKYNLRGLVKIRKSASKFVTKILQTLEVTELPDLEKLSQGEPSRWAECVANSFRCCVADELLLIEFLLRLLSDEQLSSCRGIVINRYANSKLLVKGCVLSSTLSMLLALVAGINDGDELAWKVCQWLVESAGRADEDQCHILFNAFDALAIITSSDGAIKKMNIGMALANAMNVLPLPERSRIFGTRYLIMTQSYPKELCDVDINRFVMSASSSELLEFFYLFTKAQAEIPGSAWDKATSLLFTTRPNDAILQAFVINQLAAGIQTRSSNSQARFKYVLGRLKCPKPDGEFLFLFCNGILSQLRGQFWHIVSQLVPLWIFAVLAYSRSREMDAKRFTSLIWDDMSQLLGGILPNVSMELSPGNLELFVVRFFTVLGSTASSSDIIRKTVADSVPLYLANQIATLLKSDDKELEERVIRVCGEMFVHVGSTLLAIAETEAQRIGLNQTSFVVLIQALVTKLVKSSMEPIFLLHIVPVYTSALVKLPYRMFIYSRIKDLLFKFADDDAIALRISNELTNCHGLAYHNQLTKESDPRIKKFFSIEGSK